MRYLLAVVLLTLTYLFTLASFHPWDIAFGVVFSILVLWLFRGFLYGKENNGSDGPSILSRIAFFPRYSAVVTWEIARGTWQVARVVLGFETLRQPGIVEVPIGERTRTGVVVSGIATTLSPGTILIDIDWDRGLMLIHVLDASDPEGVRADHQRMYDRYQRRVFP